MSNLPRLTIDEHHVTVDQSVTNASYVRRIYDATQAWSVLERSAAFETGFLPPNLLSYRRAGDSEQFVLVLPPARENLLIGQYEGDPDATLYYVALPYRVVIGDFYQNAFLGARMFYSPYPIMDFDAPLFHANVPNLNCRGYSHGVGVGWICLYHRDTTTHFSVAQKAAYVAARVSGSEAYNFNNMDETDGINLYSSYRPGKYFMFKPHLWEAKTEQDGIDWICDEELLIPVLVNSALDQTTHVEGGEPLTLGMAMFGRYKAYYHDDHPIKPFNVGHVQEYAHVLGTDVAITTAELIDTLVQQMAASGLSPISTTTHAKEAQFKPHEGVILNDNFTSLIMKNLVNQYELTVEQADNLDTLVSGPIHTCSCCGAKIPAGTYEHSKYYFEQDCCAECYENYWRSCNFCDESYHLDDLVIDDDASEFLCTSCDDHYCYRCAVPGCESGRMSDDTAMIVEALPGRAKGDVIALCLDHFELFNECPHGCDDVEITDIVFKANGGGWVAGCTQCIEIYGDCAFCGTHNRTLLAVTGISKQGMVIDHQICHRCFSDNAFVCVNCGGVRPMYQYAHVAGHVNLCTMCLVDCSECKTLGPRADAESSVCGPCTSFAQTLSPDFDWDSVEDKSHWGELLVGGLDLSMTGANPEPF